MSKKKVYPDRDNFSSIPLATKNWKDLVKLFGEKGACGGCWCMTWRLPAKEYQQNQGDGNKKLFHGLVKKDQPLGIIGYDNKEPVAWCSVSPQLNLLEQKRSKILSKTNFPGKWCIVCLYILPHYRRKGVATFMIEQAAAYAFDNGAKTVEAYPVIPRTDNMPDAFAWTGIWRSYEKAGFKKVSQPSTGKYIMILSK